MKHIGLSLATAVLFASLGGILKGAEAVGAAPENYWQAWEPCTIAIGNERDGFLDSVPGRRALTVTEGEAVELQMPYLAKAPDENRYFLMFTRLTADGLKGTLLESADECENWRNVPVAGGLGQNWGLCCLGHGRMIASNGFWRSEDNGRTWTHRDTGFDDPRFVGSVVGWDPPLVVPGSDGQHILDTAFWGASRGGTEVRYTPLIRESHDGGHAWTPWRGLPEFACGANEIAIAYNAKGELLAGIREENIGGVSDDHFCRLSTSISTDGGQTWAQPKVVAGNGRHHPCFATLPDGRVVLTYVVRLGYPKTDGRNTYGVEAVVSYDGGRTWDTDHRYILAKWTHDCLLKDASGDTVEVAHYYGASQSTCTLYLPESGCLITIYGTGQNRSFINEEGMPLPHQVAALKWMPMPREQYTKEKAAPPEPIPADEALAKLRATSRWAASYNAILGLPDGGWVNYYPENRVSIQDGWLVMNHRKIVTGFYRFRGLDRLVTIYRAFGLRLRVEIPQDEDDGKPNRMTLYAVLDSGPNKHSFYLTINRNANLGGNLGNIELPTEVGKPFLLEVWADPGSRRARVWVDGALVTDREYTPEPIEPEKPSTLYFGQGTRSVDGTAKLAFLQFGAVE